MPLSMTGIGALVAGNCVTDDDEILGEQNDETVAMIMDLAHLTDAATFLKITGNDSGSERLHETFSENLLSDTDRSGRR